MTRKGVRRRTSLTILWVLMQDHQQAGAEGVHSDEKHMTYKGQKTRVSPTEWLPSLAVETTVPTGKWAKGSPCRAFPIMYTGQEDSHLLRFFF